MSDEVCVQRIPRSCEIEGCDRAPATIVQLVEMSGAVIDAVFACTVHEYEARAKVLR